MNIECLGTNIRNPLAHVPLSLTDTCQLCLVSLKTGRKDYIGTQRQTHLDTAYPEAVTGNKICSYYLHRLEADARDVQHTTRNGPLIFSRADAHLTRLYKNPIFASH